MLDGGGHLFISLRPKKEFFLTNMADKGFLFYAVVGSFFGSDVTSE